MDDEQNDTTLPTQQSRRPKRAVALRYKEANELPKVLASGVDELARKILELAEQHDIPIQQDEVLANMLGKVGEGNPISSESYRLVAEVISFLYHTNKEWREQHSQLDALLGSNEHSELVLAADHKEKGVAPSKSAPALETLALEKGVNKR